MKGNQMKMREALEDMYNILEKLLLYTPQIKDVSLMRAFRGRVCRAKKIVDAALSAPARQCDVGTAEEQKARMLEYCKSHKNVDGIIICERCPHHGPNWTWCALRWAQTPYEAQEGGAE